MSIIAETERLILRELVDDDHEALAAMHARPEVMRFSPERRPLTADESARFLEWVQTSYATQGYGLWGVVEKQSGDLIGYCGISGYDIDGRHELEVGYRFDPAHWGQGYATEASRACIEFAFDELYTDRVISIIEPENTASARVAEKNGLRRERALRLYDIPVELYAVERTRRQP